MPMRCYFLTRQVAVKFWPVYKSRSIVWTDFEDLKGRLINRKIQYLTSRIWNTLVNDQCRHIEERLWLSHYR